MQISVVIPTCNRKPQLMQLLHSLDRSIYPLPEVIIVDSGEDRLQPGDLSQFTQLTIDYLSAEKSVCIQRNTGIQRAKYDWVFLCDDDMELPPDYLQKLVAHISAHPETGAVSGRWLERVEGEWRSSFPERSAKSLAWKYLFRLSIWGEIETTGNNFFNRMIREFYQRKGNHITRAGWPVLTQFSGEYFTTPLYSLGAALVKKEWLMASPFDEVLDRYGIGDNYGVAMGFPDIAIQVLNHAPVYHHKAPANRLQRPVQYYRRALALHYFISNKPRLQHVKKRWLLWSLAGNLLAFIFVRDRAMMRSGWKAFWQIAWGRNPYSSGARLKQQRVEPTL